MTQPEGLARPAAATPRIEYRALPAGSALPADVLCAVVFGDTRPVDPRCVRVGLNPLRGGGRAELWHAAGPVQIGFDAPIRYAADHAHLAGAIELDEHDFGGLAATAQAAYAALRRFQSQSSHPYLLRVWNYFDGINRGEGDAERYKQFCVGRAAGLEVQSGARLPAATAIGRRDGSSVLQIYWLAGRAPGVALENPRQTSAYRYPRQYGPSAPSFSRAMLVARRLLMISGTASIIGHVSRHPGDLIAQLDETLTNLASVQQRAAALAPALDASLSAHSLLKIYLRDAAAAQLIEELIRERMPACSQYMILEADICRSELLLEIDCLQGE
jgi:chorismate lyase/3-hydroxybenzoate synthase